MYIVSVIAYSFSIFAIPIGYNALVANSYSLYKLITIFMSYLCSGYYIVSYIAFASLVIVYFSNYLFVTIFSILLPCQRLKKGYCHKLIDRYDIHLIQWYSFAIVRLRPILHIGTVSTCL